MEIVPVLLDARPGYLRGRSASDSLLLLPLGCETVLSTLQGRLPSNVRRMVSVLPGFDGGPGYERALQAAGGGPNRVSVIGNLEDVAHDLEPSDCLLLVDASWFPCGPVNLWRRGTSRPLGSVRHLLVRRRKPSIAFELVRRDPEGGVCRIQRYYDGLTWQQGVGVATSLVPVAALHAAGVQQCVSLDELRGLLGAQGAMSEDVSILDDQVIDLSTDRGFLNLTELVLRETFGGIMPAGYSRIGSAMVGRECHIDATAKLIGPIILQDSVVVEAGATLIGPAVLGAGTHIGRQAVVAQAASVRGAVVAAGSTIRHCVFLGQGSSAPARSDARELPAEAGDEFHEELASRAFAAVSFDVPVETAVRYRRIKRAFDFVAAAFGLILLSPLLAVVAILIKLTSRGSVLFRHDREGLDGKPFRCIKFRTMHAGAHAMQRALYSRNAVDGPQFKMDNDPRTTPLGRWLRATNIDELPQLLNVLRGDMSLIGPRPSPFRENQICVPWRLARLSVRPGITGLWQVCRDSRSSGDFHQWIFFDILYVRHMGPWIDLKILAATLITLGGRWSVPTRWLIPKTALSLEGAYPEADSWDASVVPDWPSRARAVPVATQVA